MPDDLKKSITVRILGKDYSLRVEESEVDSTIEMASYLDTRMLAFQTEHPKQHEITSAVVTALAITEELFVLKKQMQMTDGKMVRNLKSLDRILTTALDIPVEDDIEEIQLALEPQEA